MKIVKQYVPASLKGRKRFCSLAVICYTHLFVGCAFLNAKEILPKCDVMRCELLAPCCFET